MERDVFLSRVARASMTAKIPAPPSVPEHLPELDRQDLVTLFRQRAIDVDAVVHGPVSRHGAPRAVTGIASGHQAETFLAWDDLPASGVASALIANGLTRIEHDAPNRDRNARLAEYRSVDIGITGALRWSRGEWECCPYTWSRKTTYGESRAGDPRGAARNEVAGQDPGPLVFETL